MLKTALNKHKPIMNANAMNQFQRLSLIALSSTILGIGILRFAYTAIMPMTIDQHWWGIEFASDLANANLLGYFIGAVLAIKFTPEHWISRYLVISALMGSFSLLGCGIHNLPDFWYLFWRLISGISGGLLMVLGPSYSLKRVTTEKKYLLSLIAFSGIGLGVLVTTTLLPQMGHLSVAISWYVLGCIGLGLTSVLYYMLKPLRRTETHVHNTIHSTTIQLNRHQLYTVLLVMMTYFMSAVGYIPHSIYWVDFIVHELNQSQNFANMLWMVYGLGSVFGALVTYLCIQRWNSYSTLWRLYLIYAVSVFIPSYWTQTEMLVISSFLSGLLNPATVSLTATLVSELVPATLQRQIWGVAVVVFAIAQYFGGFLFAYLLRQGLPYEQIYLIAAITLTIAVLIGLLLAKNIAQQTHQTPEARHE